MFKPVVSLGRFGLVCSGLSALLVLSAAGLAHAQTPPETAPAPKSETDPGSKSKPGSVYRIRVLHNFYYFGRREELYSATAVLVRAPNLLMTTRLLDSSKQDIYETYRKFQHLEEHGTFLTADVCEEE